MTARLVQFALLPALLLLAACGSGPQLDTISIREEFPGGQVPVGLLEAKAANLAPSGVGMQLGYDYSNHKYCLTFIGPTGAVVTQVECILNHPKRGGFVDVKDLRAYFRNPDSDKTEEIRIKRVEKTQLVVDKIWVWLEPQDRFYLLNKFGFMGKDDSEVTMAGSSVPYRVLSVLSPDKNGVAKFSVSTAYITHDDSLRAAIRQRALELRREETRLTVTESERMAREEIEKDPDRAIQQVGRLGVRLAASQRLETNGGIVFSGRKILAILPSTPGKRGAPRVEPAASARDVPL